MAPWLLTAGRIVTTILYKLVRLVFIAVQRVCWQLNGTARRVREARLPRNYERSAQVLDVVLRHNLSDFRPTSIDYFLCTHNRFENPQYIIDNDNINLMTITDHDAVFCETEKEGRRETLQLIIEILNLLCRVMISVLSVTINVCYTEYSVAYKSFYSRQGRLRHINDGANAP